jgi:branched-chain amino acid aminotransferase
MTDMSQTAIPTAILTPAGDLLPTPYLATSLADAAPNEPEGVYTLARTFRRDHVLLLDDHLNRLEQSANLTGITLTLDRPKLRQALRTLIEQTDYEDSRFRITIPRAHPDQLYLSIERYQPVPPEILQNGARCITLSSRRETPVAKTTAWMQQRKAHTLPNGIYEGLLLSENNATILEGMSSNFYAIIDGVLHTAGEGVLQGIAQRIVLTIAPPILPVRLTAISKNDLPFIEEAFISSAGRGVVPVIMIDQQVIGTGEPSEVTTQIQAAYDSYTATHLERL